MSSGTVIKNKFDNKEYFVSIIPVQKQIQIEESKIRTLSNQKSLEKIKKDDLGLIEFNNIIFEAAIFLSPIINPLKPKTLFSIELNDENIKKMSEDEFTKFVNNIIENEKIDDLINKDLDLYKKHGFLTIRHTMWQLLTSSEIKFIFISKIKNFKNVNTLPEKRNKGSKQIIT